MGSSLSCRPTTHSTSTDTAGCARPAHYPRAPSSRTALLSLPLTLCLLLQPFGLTRAELLQVVNLSPVSEVEVHLIVEDCEDRLNEQQVAQLMHIVSKHLPRPLQD